MGISEIWWILLIMAVGSYLIGSINFSIIISRRKGRDIRSVGSGNPGMMNMSRNFGLKTGVAILLLDMLKGGVPTFIGWVVFRGDLLEGTTFVISDMTKYLCGFFAVLGHIFPVLSEVQRRKRLCYHHRYFRGGKPSRRRDQRTVRAGFYTYYEYGVNGFVNSRNAARNSGGNHFLRQIYICQRQRIRTGAERRDAFYASRFGRFRNRDMRSHLGGAPYEHKAASYR